VRPVLGDEQLHELPAQQLLAGGRLLANDMAAASGLWRPGALDRRAQTDRANPPDRVSRQHAHVILDDHRPRRPRTPRPQRC
jgi:hypothetical protein